LTDLHLWLGVAVMAANGAAGAWGAVAWLRGEPSVVFWYLLRVAQAVVAAQVALGLLLLARGDSAPDGLHIAYGVSLLVISLFSEGFRVAVAQREVEAVGDVEALDRADQIVLARRVALAEMGVMTIGLILIVTLALRAMQSGG
jgi:hypothetical protein